MLIYDSALFKRVNYQGISIYFYYLENPSPSVDDYAKWMGIEYSDAYLRWIVGTNSLAKYNYITIGNDINDIEWTTEFKEYLKKQQEDKKEEARLKRAQAAARKWIKEENKKKMKGIVKR